jgi:hypothetical protein
MALTECILRASTTDKSALYFVIAGGILGLAASLFSKRLRPAFSHGRFEGEPPSFVARVFGVVVSLSLIAAALYCLSGGALCAK